MGPMLLRSSRQRPNRGTKYETNPSGSSPGVREITKRTQDRIRPARAKIIRNEPSTDPPSFGYSAKDFDSLPPNGANRNACFIERRVRSST
jgi:hypothetical protein